jgi:hypothetical protein
MQSAVPLWVIKDDLLKPGDFRSPECRTSNSIESFLKTR